MIGKVTNADPHNDLEDYRYILHHFGYPLTDICKEGKKRWFEVGITSLNDLVSIIYYLKTPITISRSEVGVINIEICDPYKE